MKSHFNILSLNINGLRGNDRRRNIFYWLKQLMYDIILLQDVRYCEGDCVLWSGEWGLPALWSSHNAILLTNKSMSITKLDSPGLLDRCLLGSIHRESMQEDLVVGSIYIPAERSARRQFLDRMPGNIYDSLCLLGGDFNTVANPTTDYFPAKSERASRDWCTLLEVMQLWNVSDLHTKYNSGVSQLTHWQNTQVGPVGSRIDYIL